MGAAGNEILLTGENGDNGAEIPDLGCEIWKQERVSPGCAVMNLVFMRMIIQDPLRHPTS